MPSLTIKLPRPVWRWKFGLVTHPPAYWAGISILLAYLLLCFVTLQTVEAPYVLDTGGLRLGADSTTYFTMAELAHKSPEAVAFISFGGNLLGPVALAYVLGTPLNVFLFNCIVFVACLALADRLHHVRWLIFFLLLIANATTFASVVSLNKEILALLSMLLFAVYLQMEKRSLLLLLLIFMISICVRWEQIAIIAVFLVLQRIRWLRERPRLTLFVIVMGLTVAYPFLQSGRAEDLAAFNSQGDAGSTITIFNAMQNHFGYFLVVGPKILMNLLGNLVRPTYYFTLYPEHGFLDLQNDFIIHLHSMAVALLFGYALIRRRLHLASPLVLFSCIYLVFIAMTPFIQPRYAYPAYALIALEVAKTTDAPGRKPRREASLAKQLAKDRGRPLTATEA